MADEDRPDDTYRVTLVRAVKILGGVGPLSRRLQVPLSNVTRWLAGTDKPSPGTFLKVIDILIEENRSLAERKQMRADSSQAQADRSQGRADRDQAKADRSQAAADRDQAAADRDQNHADREHGHTGDTDQTSGPKSRPLRLVQRDDSEPASNAPDQGTGKKTG